MRAVLVSIWGCAREACEAVLRYAATIAGERASRRAADVQRRGARVVAGGTGEK